MFRIYYEARSIKNVWNRPAITSQKANFAHPSHQIYYSRHDIIYRRDGLFMLKLIFITSNFPSNNSSDDSNGSEQSKLFPFILNEIKKTNLSASSCETKLTRFSSQTTTQKQITCRRWPSDGLQIYLIWYIRNI